MTHTHTSSLNVLTADRHFMSYTANRQGIRQFWVSGIALKRPKMSQNLPWQTATAWRKNVARILRASSPAPEHVANNQRLLTDKHVTWSVNITSFCDVTSCSVLARYRRFKETFYRLTELKLTSCGPVARCFGYGWVRCLHLQIKNCKERKKEMTIEHNVLYNINIATFSTSWRHHQASFRTF